MRLDTWLAHASGRVRSERAVLVLWTLTCVVGFLALARLATSGAIDGLDDAVLDWATAHRTPLRSWAMTLVSVLGTSLALALATSGVVLGLWRRKKRSAALEVAAACVMSGFLTPALKLVFARPRPPITTRLMPVDGFSFPSGHASGIAALLAAAALVSIGRATTRRRRVALVLAYGVVGAAVGASRVYLGAHYTSDVVAGLLLGIACALGAHAAVATPHAARSHARPGGHAGEASGARSPDVASDRATPPGSAPPSRARTHRGSSPAGRS